MKNTLLTIAYDGTNYGGWQVQPNSVTIEEKLSRALSRIADNPIKIVGSGRTDAKVHASGQKANVFLNTKVPVERIPFALNPFLPDDIVVRKAEEVHSEFHARYDAIKKTYRYRMNFDEFPDPILRNYSYTPKGSCNLRSIQEALGVFKGTHDFKGFMSTGSEVKSTIRTIYRIDFQSMSNSQKEIVITGNGFLYNMVRIIVGTLVDVGCGKRSISDIQKALLKGERSLAGHTAPPQGLVLEEVLYPVNPLEKLKENR